VVSDEIIECDIPETTLGGERITLARSGGSVGWSTAKPGADFRGLGVAVARYLN